MIKSIHIKNYKAFREAKFELKPITIFLGTNSSGKSSLIQLLLMLEQSFNLQSEYDSAIKLNGKYVNLGEVENIFHNKNLKQSIFLDLELNDYYLPNISEIYDNLSVRVNSIYLQLKRVIAILTSPYLVDLVFKEEESQLLLKPNHSEIVNKISEIKRFKKKIKTILKNQPGSVTILQKRLKDEFYSLRNSSKIKVKFYNKPDVNDLLKIDEIELLNSLEILEAIKNIKGRKYTLSYELKYHKDLKIYVSRVGIIINGKKLVEVSRNNINKQSKYSLVSDIIKDKLLKILHTNEIDLNFNGLGLEGKNAIGYKYSLNRLYHSHRSIISESLKSSQILLSLLENVISDTQDEFDSTSINYVNPLRAFPKRYYFLDEANVSSSLNSIDGDNLTEILKGNKLVREQVNKWLKNFNVSVTVEDLKDIIHKLKINHHGLNLDITDVGFGISQVLPILVQGFLSSNDSLTIIEQPEIHLHPNMQADLADLFIDIVNTKFEPDEEEDDDGTNKRILIIETHSEYLLKRLRRRISEGKIKSSQVALYFIKQKTSRKKFAEVDKIKVNKKGSFDWPTEFYTTDLDDTMEFLKNQNK